MIIYGSRSKQLLKESLIEKCPGCGTQNSIDMYVFQKYAHIFWLPFFPMGKTGVSQCDHCQQVLKLKQMPPDLKTAYENLKSTTKTPLWMFIGLALIAALITTGLVYDKNKSEKNTRLIVAPQTGDVLVVKTEANQYTLYKIDHVEDNTVSVMVNDYVTDKSSGIDNLKRKGANAYSDETFELTKAELKQMFDEGEIIDIDRK